MGVSLSCRARKTWAYEDGHFGNELALLSGQSGHWPFIYHSETSVRETLPAPKSRQTLSISPVSRKVVFEPPSKVYVNVNNVILGVTGNCWSGPAMNKDSMCHWIAAPTPSKQKPQKWEKMGEMQGILLPSESWRHPYFVNLAVGIHVHQTHWTVFLERIERSMTRGTPRSAPTPAIQRQLECLVCLKKKKLHCAEKRRFVCAS